MERCLKNYTNKMSYFNITKIQNTSNKKQWPKGKD